jgi:hypothetical protein
MSQKRYFLESHIGFAYATQDRIEELTKLLEE